MRCTTGGALCTGTGAHPANVITRSATTTSLIFLWTSRGRLRSTRLLDPLEDRILDEGRVARNDESHRIARVQQHVQVGDLLSKRHEHRSLSGGDLHQEPVSFSLLAYHLTFDTFTRPAAGLRKVRRNQRGSAVRRAEADDHTDEQRADEDKPSPAATLTPCSSVIVWAVLVEAVVAGVGDGPVLAPAEPARSCAAPSPQCSAATLGPSLWPETITSSQLRWVTSQGAIAARQLRSASSARRSTSSADFASPAPRRVSAIVRANAVSRG